MTVLKNSEMLGQILRSIYEVSSRRTTQAFSARVIGSIIKTLEQNYDFLKYVNVDERLNLAGDDVIHIAPDIDAIDPVRVGKAIEAIIRVIYMDLIGKAGLFFITELKKHAGTKVIMELKNYGIDLALLQVEQHYLYRRRQRKKTQAGAETGVGGGGPEAGVSLLGYTWDKVSTWEYDHSKRVCTLYDKEGKVLDQLNLDSIIESYVKSLSEGYEELPEEYEEKVVKLNAKELELLKMLRSRDMDAETATALLHISKQEFESMVRRLLEVEMLHYVSYNVIELTELGISYLAKQETEPKSTISV
jgi:hypothetical protein